VRHKVSRRVYALKVVDKHLVLRHRLVGQLRQERNILDRCCHSGIVRLHFTFQDDAAVYLGLELCPNGLSPPALVHLAVADRPCKSSP
jgi:3-phosphoinositide dependent protein kinase-1